MEKRCPYEDDDCRHAQHFPNGFGGTIILCTYLIASCDEKEHNKLSEASIQEMSRAI